MSDNYSGINWRYTAMKPRIGPFDAYLTIPPFLLFVGHIRWWTFYIMLVMIVSLWMIEIFLDMPIFVALRTLRSRAAGPIRSTTPQWKKNSL